LDVAFEVLMHSNAVCSAEAPCAAIALKSSATMSERPTTVLRAVMI
jgi:hypothetical protein